MALYTEGFKPFHIRNPCIISCMHIRMYEMCMCMYAGKNIWIVEKHAQWMEGFIDEKYGLFPSNYVKIVPWPYTNIEFPYDEYVCMCMCICMFIVYMYMCVYAYVCIYASDAKEKATKMKLNAKVCKYISRMNV